MRKLFVPLALGVLATILACGSDSSPAAPPPVTTTTTLPPAYGGAYTGSMLFNVAGQAELRGTGTVTVTHTGNNIDFGNLVVTFPGVSSVGFPLGRATLSGNTFTGTNTYASAGCGTARVATQGHFAGRLMNLSVVIDFDRCAQSRTVGEMSR